MKSYSLALLAAALLLAGCNQNPPATEKSTTTQPTATAPLDTATAPVAAAGKAAPLAKADCPALKEAEKLSMSFRFVPTTDPDNPSLPKTSVHLLLKGSKPKDIDLGRFTGKPDIVDEAKAKLAGFPAGMLLGFRSYHAASGISADLAVLNVDGRRLRIVQRRVDEQATEPPKFETSREIPLPENTMVVVDSPAKKQAAATAQ